MNLERANNGNDSPHHMALPANCLAPTTNEMPVTTNLCAATSLPLVAFLPHSKMRALANAAEVFRQ